MGSIFTLSLLWVALLLTLFYQGETVRVSLLWNAAGIAGIAAVVFGVMYNALWNHLTLKPFWNIAISSTLNLIGQYGCSRRRCLNSSRRGSRECGSFPSCCTSSAFIFMLE